MKQSIVLWKWVTIYTPYRDSIKDIDIPESNLLTIRCKRCLDSFEPVRTRYGTNKKCLETQ